MDDLIEFLCDLFLDIAEEVVFNKKISKWIRYPLLIIILVLYLAIVGLLGYCVVNTYKEQEYIASVVLLVLTILLIILFIGFLHKILKNEKSKDEDIQTKI